MAIITKIEVQKNNDKRVNLYLDNEFFCALQMYVCVKNNLKEGLQISREKLDDLLLQTERDEAMNKVANLLSKTIKTEKQVQDYLYKKGYSPVTVRFVLSKLKEYEYINDEKYIDAYIKTYRKKYGVYKIQSELLQKGIKKDILESSISSFQSSKDVVRAIAEKYMKNKVVDNSNLQKLRQHLAYKGFTWDEINSVVSSFNSNN